ncbi:hypothetical protein ABAC460_22185 [Asticcacaulis sp. AC460]|uniref:hypothetical protein n=1 Tax=Asticcacaulis sp. AC460 TaxID=1282360 RepID=UPI0003C40938|nr:hypothetical protein [Asticcacaulis sp. AC460]ESQ86762.1 hypothetical protein ABAC460_22185 [Asticcacaulis sp. AC460]
MKFAAKCLGLWLAMVATTMISGMILSPGAAPPTAGEPLTAFQAMAIVYAVQAIVIAVLAANIHLARLPKVIVLFVIIFGTITLMSWIEAIFFNASLKMSSALLTFMLVNGAISAAVVAIVSAFLWPSKDSQPLTSLGGLWWKLAVISPLYVFAYYAAGTFIAWQSETLRAYYAQGINIDQSLLVPLQVVRGLMWGGLAAIIVKSVHGSALFRGLMVGITLACLCTIVLLMPNPVMPWPVRQIHFVEVFVSNFLFGWAAGAILLAGERKPAVPQPA